MARRASEQRELMDTTAKGAVSELLIANAVTTTTGGRLKVARSWPDDHGVDFVAYQPGFDLHLELQVKAAYAVGKFGALQFRVNLKEVPPGAGNWFLLGCRVLPGLQGLGPAMWLIPGSALPRPRPGRAFFQLSVWPAKGSRSKWNAYRIEAGDRGNALRARLATLAASRGRKVPRPWDKDVPEATWGWVSENAIVHAVARASDGAICAFRPVADTVGMDLAFASMDGTAAVAAQLKGTLTEDFAAKVFARVPEATFRPRKDRLLLVSAYSRKRRELAPKVWVMTMAEFAASSHVTGGVRHMSASPREGAKDKWVRYRYDLSELAVVVGAAVEGRRRFGAAARLTGDRRALEHALFALAKRG